MLTLPRSVRAVVAAIVAALVLALGLSASHHAAHRTAACGDAMGWQNCQSGPQA